MKLTINGQDVSAWLDAQNPLSVVRKLNEPSVCKLWLGLPVNSAAPVRGQAVSVQGDDGTLYFTGYIAVTPLPEFAGIALEGPRYRLAIEAISDEMVMDQSVMAPSRGAAGMAAGALITALATRMGGTGLLMQGVSLNAPVNWYASAPGASWSKSAGQVAEQARAAYRALGGAVTLAQIPVSVHALNEVDGSLNLANLTLAAGTQRLLANDVTVCGEAEPAAYVTEFFQGDGATLKFELGADPYVLGSGKAMLIRELFNEAAIDATVWANSGGGYLSLGAGGLQMKGGSGIDGDTQLTWIEPVEMGGTLLLEASGVSLNAGSTGVLSGFFAGLNTLAGCVAGFQATAQAGTGAVTLQPVVLGTATGATFTINPANNYTLRIRVHCCEQERARAIYRSYGDNGAVTTGGQSVDAAGKLHFQIQEYVNGVAGMPVTLYDGAIASLPGACSVLAVSSLNMIGTMRALNLNSLGSAWVTSTPENGAACSRRLGTVAEGGECHVERTGYLAFYAGSAPAVGEQVAVSYRAVRRASGRAVMAQSQGVPNDSYWIGSVTNPPARSSADCRSAAQAMVAGASSLSGLWSGAYKATNWELGADVWPGDALQLNATSAGLNAQVVVRAVTLSYSASIPDVVRYVIAFANDWADDLAIKSSATVPMDAWLPAPVLPMYAGNLSGLSVTCLNGLTVSITTGVAPPSGGGFEVRRRDYAFMPGEDADLVMRGAQQNMTLARQSANDRFYVRVYDGATPPNYSEFSAALFINLPLGS